MKNIFTIFEKKTIFTLALLLFAVSASFGQVPSFYNNNGNSGSASEPLNSNSNNKVQWIYGPSVFNSMGIIGGTPAYFGLITKVYFRCTNSSTPTYANFTISLAQNVGTQPVFGNTTFNQGMTTVFQSASYGLTTAANNWFSFTLPTPFLYDPSQSIIVEVKQNNLTGAGALLAQVNTTSTNHRIQGAFANPTGTSFGPGQANFGFDLIQPTPCSSLTMNVGTIVPTNPTVCAGKSLSLSAPNATVGSGINYQWQQSVAAPFTTWTNIAGATNLNYQTIPLATTTHYRLIFHCAANNARDTSVVNVVTVSPPTYATLPYFQGFENWASYCGNNDVPNDFRWSNMVTTGNESWRREDDGVSASWNGAAGGLYFPTSTEGNHSARFHSYFSTGVGNLDLYLDCSGPGSKTLSFDYINNNQTNGSDFLTVQYSINGAAWVSVALQGGSLNGTWQPLTAAINSQNALTRVRFSASGGTNLIPASDIGIDNVKVIPPCAGQPVAGTIDSTTACPNKPLLLSLVGNTSAGNLTYGWDTSSTPNGPWGFFQNSPGPNLTVTLSKSIYFRCRVRCTGSNLIDTTIARRIDFLPFYICYCDNGANTQFFENIGNVQILTKPNRDTVLNNGAGLPSLSNSTAVNLYSLFFPSVTPPILYKDSAYYLNVKGISFINSFSNCYVKVYIDFNRDGVYNVTNEVALKAPITAATNYIRLDSFKVPAITNFGLTGMRVILQEGGNQNTVLPCGAFNRGEVEDYVINLQRLPCNQPPSAGVSIIDDSTVCPNNQVRIINNTHDRFFANLDFSWQESTDGVSFTDIVGGDVDTMLRIVSQTMWYRYRVTCQGSSVSFSNIIKARVLPPLQCISVSASTGPNDISDIGALVISETPPANTNLYTFNTGGPHLNNFAAYKYYTNRTAVGALKLKVDTSYKLSIFHILNTPTHTDAQVSVFIDFNNDQMFDPASELVFSGISTAAIGGFLFGNMAIPATAVLSTPVIMRVVLNDDLGINSASSTGVGPYISGETEDYYLTFVPKLTPIGVENIADIDEVGIYPNPTSGELNIDFVAKQTTNVNVEIVNLTGSVLRTEAYGHVSGQQHFTMNVSDLAAGVYLMRFTTDNAKFVRKITVK